MAPLFSYGATGREARDPVTGGRIISGMVPCNEIADGVLSDHPERTRAMIVESANPAHSLAGSEKFRRAMGELDFSVVIDVAMTETAQQAHYVLPASSQYEKVETTFFSFGFPENHFCVRPPILDPLDGTLPEPEIHSRIVQAMGLLRVDDLAPLRAAAGAGLAGFGTAFREALTARPELAGIGAIVLYETLGRTLPAGMEGAAALWFSAQQTAQRFPEAVRAAGFTGDGPELGDALFEAIITSPDGVVITVHDQDEAWDLLGTADHRIHLEIPELLAELDALGAAPAGYTSADYPFVLSAGERRSFTANTIMRDPSWRKRDPEGALRLSPDDAAGLGVVDGSRVRVVTATGTAVAVAAVDAAMQPGHVALPNGMGLGYSPAGGDPELVGVAPNELTDTAWRDEIAGTPWHKHVPARLEVVPA